MAAGKEVSQNHLTEEEIMTEDKKTGGMKYVIDWTSTAKDSYANKKTEGMKYVKNWTNTAGGSYADKKTEDKKYAIDGEEYTERQVRILRTGQTIQGAVVVFGVVVLLLIAIGVLDTKYGYYDVTPFSVILSGGFVGLIVLWIVKAFIVHK